MSAVQPSTDAGETPQRVPTEAEITTMLKREVQLARGIYEQVIRPNFEATTMEWRAEVFQKHYPEFMKRHPIICKYMVAFGAFSAVAMQQYIDLQRRKPAKCMEDSMHISAQYPRLMYIANEKARGGHYCTKRANEIARGEEAELLAEYKKIKKQEQDARNSYEEESARHDLERRSDILKFINTHEYKGEIVLDDEDLALRQQLFGHLEAGGVPIFEQPAATTTQATPHSPRADPPQEDPIELVLLQYRAAMVRIAELTTEVELKQCRIERIEEGLLQRAKAMRAADNEDWLIGTSARPTAASDKVPSATSGKVSTASQGKASARRAGKARGRK